MPLFRTYCIERWSIDVENDIQEVTSTCGNGWSENIAGTSNWSCEFSVFIDYFNSLESPFFDPVPNNSAGTAINLKPQFMELYPGQRVLLTARFGGPGLSATVHHELQGSALVSKIGWENPCKNPIKGMLSVKGNGPINYTFEKLGLLTPLLSATPATSMAFGDDIPFVNAKTPKTPDTHAAANAKSEADKPVLKA